VLLVMNEADARLNTVARWGGDPGLPESFPGECCWAMRRGQAHTVRDPANGLVCDHFSTVPTAPYICLPLPLKGRLLGLLHIGAGADIDESRWQRLTQVGTALGNAIKPVLGKLLPLDPG
jgi:GAF domain-containing protein